MYRILPKWYGEVEDEIKRTISVKANQLNIKMTFIFDSKIIDESVQAIMNVLVRLKEEVHGEFDEKTFKDFKKLKEDIEKKEIKKSNTKIKGEVKRYSSKSSNKK